MEHDKTYGNFLVQFSYMGLNYAWSKYHVQAL
jgi:hypothetical protein